MDKIKISLKNLYTICLLLYAHNSIAIPIYSDAYYQNKILMYINSYRAQHHLVALKLNSQISQLAKNHSLAMARKNIKFSHANFNQRINKLYKKFKHCNGGAENIAYYKLNAKKLVEQWVLSPGHRRNILGHYNFTGIGIAQSKAGWAYYTQIFLSSGANGDVK